MQDFVNKREKVINLMRNVANFAKSQNREDLHSEISYEAHYLAEGKLTLMVAGEFKRGKSSLINMLLEEQDLCPVAVHITTCAVTVITYGKQERITVYFRRDNDPTGLGVSEGDKGLEITREQLKDYCSEQYNQRNAKKVSLIKIELPNQLLEKGLVIVDTPGVGGLHYEHSLITMGFMSSADAMLFVCDAQNPVAESEIQFLQRSAEYTKNFVFAMTHKDMVVDSDYQRVLEGNRKKIANGLGLEIDRVKIIPVSSKLKEKYLTTGIEEYLENSNYPELEKEIWDMLTGRGGSILLLRALLVLDTAINEVKQPIADELAILQAKDKQEMQSLENEIKELRKQVEAQSSKQAEWRSELTKGIRQISIEINALLHKGFNSIRPNVKSYVQENIEKNGELVPDATLQLVEQDIQANNAKVARELGIMVTNLTKRIEQSAGINLNSFDVGDAKLELSKSGLERNFNKRDTWELVRNSVMGSGIGATIAGVVCGSMGAIAGLFTGGVASVPLAIASAKAGATLWLSIGGLFGAGFGAKKSQQLQASRIEATFLAALDPILRNAETDGGTWISTTILQLESDMSQDFTNKLTKHLEQIKDTEKKFHAAYTTSKADMAERIAALKPGYNALSSYQKDIEQHISSIKQNMDSAAS